MKNAVLCAGEHERLQSETAQGFRLSEFCPSHTRVRALPRRKHSFVRLLRHEEGTAGK